MISEDVKAFKTRLRNYAWLLSCIKKTQNEIDAIEYEMTGVKGVQYDKESGGANTEEKKFDKYLKLSNKLEQTQKRLEHYMQEKKMIDDVLEAMSEMCRNVAKNVYVEGRSFDSLVEVYFMSATGLRKRMEKEMLNAMEANEKNN